MKSTEFYDLVWEIKNEGSPNANKQKIRDLVDNEPKEVWRAAIILLSGQRFSSNGVAPKTAMKAFSKGLNVSQERIKNEYSDHGTVMEAIETIVEEDDIEVEDDDITDIVDNLGQVAELSGDAQVSRLANLFATSNPMVVSFGVLTDDFKIGISYKTIASGIAHEYDSTEVERGRGIINDSVEFIEYVQSGAEFPPSVTVGEPFEPMKASGKDLPEDTENGWVAQLKVDGFRLLVHVDDGVAKAFTRNLEDVTMSLPELGEIEWPNGQYVFDCEAIAYENGEAKGYRATSERIGRKHNIGEFTTDIHFEFFDCIFANGDIGGRPLMERYEILQDSLPEHEFVTRLENIESISEAKSLAEDGGYEGLIVKDLDSKYMFDKRSTQWRKFKLTDETIDLRVIEFENGKGEDSDTLGRMGLETADGEFMGYVGNGWTDEEQDEIWENQEKYHGMIAEISFEGIDEKLRFPVFKNWRPHGEADSLERVKNIGGNY